MNELKLLNNHPTHPTPPLIPFFMKKSPGPIDPEQRMSDEEKAKQEWVKYNDSLSKYRARPYSTHEMVPYYNEDQVKIVYPLHKEAEEFRSSFNAELFSWRVYGYLIPILYKEKFDAQQFNWKEHSWAVAKYAPECLDSEKYNWEEYTREVILYAPEKIDLLKFHWEVDTIAQFKKTFQGKCPRSNPLVKKFQLLMKMRDL